MSGDSFDYIVLTAAIPRPELHSRVFPGHLRMIGSARVKWLVNVDDADTGDSVDDTIENLTRLLTAPNIDLEFLRPTGPGCFFQATRRLARRAGELLHQCRTGVVWLEDDWLLSTRNPLQEVMNRLRFRLGRNAAGDRLSRCPGNLHDKQAMLDHETTRRNAVWFVSLVPRNLVSFNPGIWSKDLFARAILQTLSDQPTDQIDDPETLCADPWNQPGAQRGLTLFIDPAYQDAGRQWSAERGLTKWEKIPDVLARRGSVTYASGDECRRVVPNEAFERLTGCVTLRRAFGTPLTLLGRIVPREGRLTGRLLAFPHIMFDLHPTGDGAAEVYMHRLHGWTHTYPYKKIAARVTWQAAGQQLQVQTGRGPIAGSLSRSMPISVLWLGPLQASVGVVYYAVTLIRRLINFDGNPKNP